MSLCWLFGLTFSCKNQLCFKTLLLSFNNHNFEKSLYLSRKNVRVTWKHNQTIPCNLRRVATIDGKEVQHITKTTQCFSFWLNKKSMPLFSFIFDQLPSFYVKIDYTLIYCRKKEIALLYSNTKIYSKWLENSHAFEILWEEW